MPNRDYIQTIAHELIAKFDTRDPFELCKAIGVEEYNSHLFRFPGGTPGGPYADLKQQAKEYSK